MNLPIYISEEVQDALASKKGVVALESTIIAHGLPYPDNLHIANALEETVREQGATPATIAILDGNFCIGLDHTQIEKLADPQMNVKKVSRRDIAYTIATKGTGATTVAATMIGAKLAGIQFFATGGLGGVHRGVESTLDISADIFELSRTAIAVVCAGVKSILDIPKTLELLETLGVPVFGYRTTFFPEFYCVSKNHPLEMCFQTPQELVDTLKVHWDLGLKSGVVIAQPVSEERALPHATVEKWIVESIDEAEKHQIEGKHLTPYLLKNLSLKSERRTIATNRDLVIENARLAAQIAAIF